MFAALFNLYNHFTAKVRSTSDASFLFDLSPRETKTLEKAQN